MVSIFANDFAGDIKVVLEGRGGDWEEAKYWLGRIRDFCFARGIPCLFVPAPWVNQLDQPQLAGNYPGPISNILETTGIQYLDPINEFADALLAIEIEGLRRGEPVTGDPLFNGRIGDGHFSPPGARSGPSASAGGSAAPDEAASSSRPRHSDAPCGPTERLRCAGDDRVDVYSPMTLTSTRLGRRPSNSP